jgi:N-methylhydantoinase A
MLLDVAAAERAIKEKIANPLALSVRDAALGIVRIADSAMSLAVRAVSVNKGVDPRDTAIIAFGGGGPLHACAIAREIFVPKVIVPKLPGTFSALGMLMASWRQDFVRTLIGRLGTLNTSVVMGVFDDLNRLGEDQITRENIPKTAATFTFYANLRYAGQEHTIPIPVSGTNLLTGDLGPLRKMFHTEHAKRYSQSAPDESMEIVSLRLVVTAPRQDRLAERWLSEPWQAEGTMQETMRDVVFDDPQHPLRARILWRPSLPSGTMVEGPAVIEEPNATTLVHPGDVASVNEAGHLIIAIGGV